MVEGCCLCVLCLTYSYGGVRLCEVEEEVGGGGRGGGGTHVNVKKRRMRC